MLRSETVTKLIPALLAAQKEFPKVAKNSDNPFFKSKYAELPAILDAVNPVLHKHGLLVLQGTADTVDGHIKVETAIYHDSGEYISSSLDVKLAKDDPQGAGSGITYARRYGVCLALGIAPDKDDDGNAASGKVEPVTVTKTAIKVKPDKLKVLEQIKTAKDRDELLTISAGVKKVAKDFSLPELTEIKEAGQKRLLELAGTGQNQ